MSEERGALIVVEGDEGCEKTAFCKGIVADLTMRGINAEYYAFTHVQDEIMKICKRKIRYKEESAFNESLQILQAANRWSCAVDMKISMKSGTTFVVDSYAYSSIAYSVAIGLNLKWCRRLESELPKPDQVYFLSLDSDSIESLKQIPKLVHHGILKMKESNWNILDAGEKQCELQSQLIGPLLTVIDNAKLRPIYNLW